jgi:hypothetical protein
VTFETFCSDPLFGYKFRRGSGNADPSDYPPPPTIKIAMAMALAKVSSLLSSSMARKKGSFCLDRVSAVRRPGKFSFRIRHFIWMFLALKGRG